MPNHEEHCQHSFKRYGVRGDDIHSWIDEPSQIMGGEHRKFRHDLASLPICLDVFKDKYTPDMIENIFLDHLKADSEEGREKRQENIPQKYISYQLPTDEQVEADVLGQLREQFPHENFSLKKLNMEFFLRPVHKIVISVHKDFRTTTRTLSSVHFSNKIVFLPNDSNQFFREDTVSFFQNSPTIEIPKQDNICFRDEHAVKEIAISQIISKTTHTVNWVSGHGNYRKRHTKTLVISPKHITIHSIEKIMLPFIKFKFSINNTTHFVNGLVNSFGNVFIGSSSLQKCQICSSEEALVLCNNCGKVLCKQHSFSCAKCGRCFCREHGFSKRKFLVLKEEICNDCFSKLGDNSYTKMELK